MRHRPPGQPAPASTGAPWIDSHDQRVAVVCVVVAEWPVRAALDLIIAGFEQVGAPARRIRVGLLAADAGSTEVEIETTLVIS